MKLIKLTNTQKNTILKALDEYLNKNKYSRQVGNSALIEIFARKEDIFIQFENSPNPINNIYIAELYKLAGEVRATFITPNTLEVYIGDKFKVSCNYRNMQAKYYLFWKEILKLYKENKNNYFINNL